MHRVFFNQRQLACRTGLKLAQRTASRVRPLSSANTLDTGSSPASSPISDLINTEEVHHTLPSVCYYEQEHFDNERKQVMEKSWLLTGHMNVLLPEKGSIAEVNFFSLTPWLIVCMAFST